MRVEQGKRYNIHFVCSGEVSVRFSLTTDDGLILSTVCGFSNNLDAGAYDFKFISKYNANFTPAYDYGSDKVTEITVSEVVR